MKKLIKILATATLLTALLTAPTQAAVNIAPNQLSGSVVQIKPYMIHTQASATISSVTTQAPTQVSTEPPSNSQQASSVVSLRGLIPTRSVTVPAPATGNPDDVLFQAPPANEKLVMPQLVPATALTDSEQEMVNEINQERAKAGLPPVKVDLRLVAAARFKAEDMYLNHYFDHVSPNIGYTGSILPKLGLNVGYWSENIAGNDSVEGAMSAFMFSYGHRINILDPHVNCVGVGIIEGITPYNLYVQEFVHE